VEHYGKYPLLFQVLITRQILEKSLEIKFPGSPSSGSPVIPCERTDGRLTDMTKVIVALSNFANSSKKEVGLWDHRTVCVCVCVCVCV